MMACTFVLHTTKGGLRLAVHQVQLVQDVLWDRVNGNRVTIGIVTEKPVPVETPSLNDADAAGGEPKVIVAEDSIYDIGCAARVVRLTRATPAQDFEFSVLVQGVPPPCLNPRPTWLPGAPPYTADTPAAPGTLAVL